MLKFEGIKKFNIEKIDNEPQISRNFQIIFTDNYLDEDECGIVEGTLNKHNFNIKDDIVKLRLFIILIKKQLLL